MEFVSSSKMKRIDFLASKRFGIPPLILMENAGRSVAEEAKNLLKNKSAKVVIFCGYGDNGGDGLVSARHLVNIGYEVEVFLVGRQKKMSHDTKINFNVLNKMKVKIKKIMHGKQIESLIKHIRKARLIIDAIFGIGIKGELSKFYAKLFEGLNNTSIPILSIDIPSGLDADTGMALPIAIKARKTVAMGLSKKGFLNPSAKKYLGKITIADISLPRQLK